MDTPKKREDYTLKELENLKDLRVTQAFSDGIFQKVLEIGRHLGEPVESENHGTFGIFIIRPEGIPIDPIVVIYREITGRMIPTSGGSTWETIEQVSVCLGPDGATNKMITRLDGSGNPQCYQGLRVLLYEKSTHPTGDEEEYFAPGKWVQPLIDHYTRAEFRRMAAQEKKESAARDNLYYAMLLDKDI